MHRPIITNYSKLKILSMSVSRQESVSSHHQFYKAAYNNLKQLQFSLTSDQCTIIQHYLPKGYALLIKKRSGTQHRRDRGNNLDFHDTESISKISRGLDTPPSEKDCRSKTNRIKKVDRSIDDKISRSTKRTETSKSIKQEKVNPYQRVLNGLKKSGNSYPFLQPVDPKLTGALNYFDIIKQPMDLSTVQINYKRKIYDSFEAFNADIRRIWQNSYTYNDNASKIYKMTRQMEKLHNKLIEGVEQQEGPSKNVSRQKYSNPGLKRSKAQIDNDNNIRSQRLRKR